MSTDEVQKSGGLTVDQIRMAQAALGWSNPMLAEKTGRAENGDAKRSTLELLRHVFEAAGLEFIPENGGGAGIRFRERKAS